MRPKIRICVLTLVVGAVAACAVSPTGRRQLALVSEDSAIAASDEAYAMQIGELREEGKIVPGSARVAQRVERITERGLVVDGVEHEVDCILFATGFEVGRTHPAVSGSPTVHGRDGITFAEHWRHGIRTFHGLTAHGFPNLFCLGISQNAVAVNFVHVLDEQAVHVAAIVKEAEQRRADYVEPTTEAEDAWLAVVRQTNRPDPVLAECTPGYKNNEGMPVARPDSYGGTALEFHALIRKWRDGDGFADVLRGGTG